VLYQRPVTLDNALNAVCHMEAYGLPNDADVSADPSDRWKVRTLKSDDMKDNQAAVTNVNRHHHQLEQRLESQRREVLQFSANTEHWRQRAMAAELAVQYISSSCSSAITGELPRSRGVPANASTAGCVPATNCFNME